MRKHGILSTPIPVAVVTRRYTSDRDYLVGLFIVVTGVLIILVVREERRQRPLNLADRTKHSHSLGLLLLTGDSVHDPDWLVSDSGRMTRKPEVAELLPVCRHNRPIFLIAFLKEVFLGSVILFQSDFSFSRFRLRSFEARRCGKVDRKNRSSLEICPGG
jgi:hypothetical protein